MHFIMFSVQFTAFAGELMLLFVIVQQFVGVVQDKKKETRIVLTNKEKNKG